MKKENDADHLEEKMEDQNLSEDGQYNRKQRRHIQRQMIREEKKKIAKAEKLGNTFVTRREFVGLFQSTQKLRDRLYYIDVLTAAIEKILLEKNLITEDELRTKIEEESERAVAFQEIQRAEKDYENRLKRLVELRIDPNVSVVGQQLYEDPDVELSEKIRLAKEYNLQVLLKLFESQNLLVNTGSDKIN